MIEPSNEARGIRLESLSLPQRFLLGLAPPIFFIVVGWVAWGLGWKGLNGPFVLGCFSGAGVLGILVARWAARDLGRVLGTLAAALEQGAGPGGKAEIGELQHLGDAILNAWIAAGSPVPPDKPGL